MRIRKKRCCMFLILMSLFLVLNIHSAYSVDELVLTGVIKSIDYKAKIVIIDVESESCPGVRRFRFDDASILGSEPIGRKIPFLIDSSTCRDNKIHKIIR